MRTEEETRKKIDDLWNTYEPTDEREEGWLSGVILALSWSLGEIE